MDLLDTNILIGAFRADDPAHRTLKAWLEATLGEHETVTFPPLVEIAFVRIVTHPKVFVRPSTLAEAEGFLADLRQTGCFRDAVWTPRIRERAMGYCRNLRLAGDDVNDAFLAATASVMGCRLVSRDRGFARFKGLAWFDPTAGANSGG